MLQELVNVTETLFQSACKKSRLVDVLNTTWQRCKKVFGSIPRCWIRKVMRHSNVSVQLGRAYIFYIV